MAGFSDQGAFTIYVNEEKFGRFTFTWKSDGAFTSDTKITYAGQTVGGTLTITPDSEGRDAPLRVGRYAVDMSCKAVKVPSTVVGRSSRDPGLLSRPRRSHRWLAGMLAWRMGPGVAIPARPFRASN
jgi:hypothetical protein